MARPSSSPSPVLAHAAARADALSGSLAAPGGRFDRLLPERHRELSFRQNASFFAVLRAPELQDPLVHLGNVSGYRQQALAASR